MRGVALHDRLLPINTRGFKGRGWRRVLVRVGLPAHRTRKFVHNTPAHHWLHVNTLCILVLQHDGRANAGESESAPPGIIQMRYLPRSLCSLLSLELRTSNTKGSISDGSSRPISLLKVSPLSLLKIGTPRSGRISEAAYSGRKTGELADTFPDRTAHTALASVPLAEKENLGRRIVGKRLGSVMDVCMKSLSARQGGKAAKLTNRWRDK